MRLQMAGGGSRSGRGAKLLAQGQVGSVDGHACVRDRLTKYDAAEGSSDCILLSSDDILCLVGGGIGTEKGVDFTVYGIPIQLTVSIGIAKKEVVWEPMLPL
jgi:hypothetical protein